MRLVKAMYDYNSDIDPDCDKISCLHFNKGDILLLKENIDINWAEGFNITKMNGRIFPTNFVEDYTGKIVRVKAVKASKVNPKGTRVNSTTIYSKKK